MKALIETAFFIIALVNLFVYFTNDSIEAFITAWAFLIILNCHNMGDRK